jgi:hypothetical protein
MSFVAIDANEIEVGDALKKELFDKIKDNSDDHETRIADLETGAKRIPVFKYLLINAAAASTLTGLNYYIADEDFTLVNAYIGIFEKGALTGAIEIDVKKSTTNMDSASFATVFTTKPKITLASASDYDKSTNQVFDNGQISISAGNILRLDVTQMPGGAVLSKLMIVIYGEK